MRYKLALLITVVASGLIGGLTYAKHSRSVVSGTESMETISVMQDTGTDPTQHEQSGSTTSQAIANSTSTTRKPSRRNSDQELKVELGAGMFAALPKSLFELANSADLIVVGRIGPVVNQGMYYGSDEDAPRREALDQPDRPPLGLPTVDYSIEVEDTLKESKHLTAGQSPVLRLFGYPGLNTDLPEMGDRYILFLLKNSDSDTFGVPSIMHWISLNGSSPAIRVGRKEFAPFGLNVQNEEFIAQVAQIAKGQGRAELEK